MRLWTAILFLALAFSLACEPVQPTKEEAQSYVRKMTFERHPNGQCFGVIKFSMKDGWVGVSVTAVESRLCQ